MNRWWNCIREKEVDVVQLSKMILFHYLFISGKPNKFLTSFSLYSNTIILFSTDEKKRTLSALRGCRVLMTFWVVLVHTYLYIPYSLYFIKYSEYMLKVINGMYNFRLVQLTLFPIFCYRQCVIYYEVFWRILLQHRCERNPCSWCIFCYIVRNTLTLFDSLICQVMS